MPDSYKIKIYHDVKGHEKWQKHSFLGFYNVDSVHAE